MSAQDSNTENLQSAHVVGSGAVLACPFCGGEASATGEVKYSENHKAWWNDGTRICKAYFCNCMKCGVTNKGLSGHQTPALALAHWNTRGQANLPHRPQPAK